MDDAYSPFHAVYDVKHGHCSLCAELPEIPGSCYISSYFASCLQTLRISSLVEIPT